MWPGFLTRTGIPLANLGDAIFAAALGVLDAALGVFAAALGVLDAAFGVFDAALGVLDAALGVFDAALGVLDLGVRLPLGRGEANATGTCGESSCAAASVVLSFLFLGRVAGWCFRELAAWFFMELPVILSSQWSSCQSLKQLRCTHLHTLYRSHARKSGGGHQGRPCRPGGS